jgi:hypothetical protein
LLRLETGRHFFINVFKSEPEPNLSPTYFVNFSSPQKHETNPSTKKSGPARLYFFDESPKFRTTKR